MKPRHAAASSKVLKLDGPECRARRDAAQARFLELKTEKEAGRLLDAEEVEKAWSAEIAAARAFLLTLPTAWADRVFRAATLAGEGGVGAVERELRAAAHDALRELASGRHAEGAHTKKRARRTTAPVKEE